MATVPTVKFPRILVAVYTIASPVGSMPNMTLS
jgi:hypothetical protein